MEPLLQVHESAYIIFDDTVLDKRYSEDIELTRRQYSGTVYQLKHGLLSNYLIQQLKRPALAMILV